MWIAPERHSARRWAVPVLALVAGVALAVLLALRDQGVTGLVCLAVLAGYSAHLGYRRNEPALTFSDAFGSGHRARTQLRAAAMTGDVLVGALVAAVVVQALRGAEVMPYAWPLAVAGATYALTALVAQGGP